MNPLHWKSEHQLAWVMTCLLGAVLGLFVGFVVSLGDANRAAGFWFWVWIGTPELFWPWPIFGATIAGLAAYTAKLWKNSN